MTDKELVAKIKELKSIEPEKDWVLSTRTLIFGVEKPPFSLEILKIIFSVRKPVFAVLLILFVFVGAFGFAQNSLPGDFLFPIKKIAETSKTIFASREEKSKIKLEFANKRLEELTRVAESNQVKKLAPAIEEFEASLVEAARELTLALPKDSMVPKKPQVREIVKATEKLEENKEKAQALGVVIETGTLDNALAEIVRAEIEQLENTTLTEGQLSLLERAKEDFEKGDYSRALEKILILSNIGE